MIYILKMIVNHHSGNTSGGYKKRKMNMIDKAIEFATKAHEGQFRKGPRGRISSTLSRLGILFPP